MLPSEEYIDDLKKGLAPSLKDMLYSYTFEHDHLLKNPDLVRTSLYKYIYGDFREYHIFEKSGNDGYEHDDNSCKVYKEITNTESEYCDLIRWKSKKYLDPLKFNPGCCWINDIYLVRLDINVGNIEIVHKMISESYCLEGQTRKYHYKTKEIPKKELENISLKDILTKCPILIDELMIEENIDLIIKMLDE